MPVRLDLLVKPRDGCLSRLSAPLQRMQFEIEVGVLRVSTAAVLSLHPANEKPLQSDFGRGRCFRPAVLADSVLLNAPYSQCPSSLGRVSQNDLTIVFCTISISEWYSAAWVTILNLTHFAGRRNFDVHSSSIVSSGVDVSVWQT